MLTTATTQSTHEFRGCYYGALDGLVINGWVFNPDPDALHFVCSTACRPPLDYYAEWWFVPTGENAGRFQLFVTRYRHVAMPQHYVRHHGIVIAEASTIHEVLRHCCGSS